MSTALLLLGANHKVAPIDFRERLAFSKAQLAPALRQLMTLPEIDEVFLLSTCNRTEIYAIGDPIAAPDRLRAWLSETKDIATPVLECCLYEHQDSRCAEHLFRVAAGLDSMVLGEVQILGQVKDSYSLALEHDTLGKKLDALIRKAIETGKRARSETRISAQAASISYVAVELARRIFGDIRTARTVVVGAGEMSELVAQTLYDNGAQEPVFANRTQERSAVLAQRYHGSAIGISELQWYLTRADIVVTSTDAPHYVLRRSSIEQVVPAREGRPLFIIDLAVPRDVEPSTRDVPNVYVYNVDDLQAVVDANLGARSDEVAKVERIIEAELADFTAWQRSLDVVPTIASLCEFADEVRRYELARHTSKLSSLSDEQRQAVEALTTGIVNKLMHRPVTRLKSAASDGKAKDYVQAVRELFGLEELVKD